MIEMPLTTASLLSALRNAINHAGSVVDCHTQYLICQQLKKTKLKTTRESFV